MRQLDIIGKLNTSKILVGERLQKLGQYISGRRTVIITDPCLIEHYGASFPDCPVILIGCGESIKNLETAHQIFQRLVDLEMDRSAMIVGIGGGIVCDITGFVASTYMRGVNFGFVASTLLAQVDASVGGKNGVNFGGFKNMVGVFNQPEFVICDMDLLKTLPERELSCGFSEIVKHAIIADADMFAYLEKMWPQALMLDTDVIEKLVYDSVVIKSGVVSRDETEKGERRILNFGHTIGHAIEKISEFPHGEAVGIGMVVAAHMAEKLNLISVNDVARIVSLLDHLNLPVRLNGYRDEILSAMRKDKKREGDEIHFILPSGIGKAVIRSIPFRQLETLTEGLL
jgi:3-dehydroquinate synthase